MCSVENEYPTDTKERTAIIAEAHVVTATEAQVLKHSETSLRVPNSCFLNELAVNAASSTKNKNKEKRGRMRLFYDDNIITEELTTAIVA